MLGGADFDDVAGLHEDDAVRYFSGEAHLVSNNDHCHAVAGEVLHYVEYFGDHLGVER